jgi:putative CocE/NonD family hydrolase
MATFTDNPTVWIPLPDGTQLAARLFMPKGAQSTPVPAVIEYLPYRRRDATALRDDAVYPAFADMGLAGVRVDLRGTGDSEGLFDDEYSETELSDAEAVIAWIAAQPWCNGNVGMMGISWGGFNALQLAARRPPALKAVISIASTVDRFADDIHYRGGAQMSANLYWATQMLYRAALPPDAAVVGADWRKIWLHRLENLPALIFPWLSHQRRDAYWRHGSICEDYSALQAPALMIAGWADGYRNTPWMAREGLGDGARSMTGPWVHLYPYCAVPGPRIDFMAEAARWWGRWLQDKDTGAEDLPAHRLWLSEAVRPDQPRMHEPGRWIAIDQGAPVITTLFLSRDRLTNSPGEGQISIRTPLDCGVDGGEFFTQGSDSDLPGDQRADDGLSTRFETDILSDPLDIIGRPVLRLPVAIDAPQGTLVARLVDVHPDGSSHRISLGILNLSHRDGPSEPRPMEPGRQVVVDIPLDVAAYRVLPGHRLRLAVSTSYFPLVLPPPTDVTATVGLDARAALDLPCEPFQEIDLPQVPDPSPAYPRLTPATAERRITRECGTRRTTVVVDESSGDIRHPGHGMEWRSDRLSEWSITRGDPLSMVGHERAVGMRRRGGVETVVTASGAMRVSGTDWIVEASIEATEDGRVVFRRDWSDRIARDHM